MKKKLTLEELKEGTVVKMLDYDKEMGYVMIINIHKEFIASKRLLNLHAFNNDDYESKYDYEKVEFYALNEEDKEIVKLILKHEAELLDNEVSKYSGIIQRIGGRTHLIKSLKESIEKDDV
jgi:hypothetical protein